LNQLLISDALAQLSQTDHTAGWVSWASSGRRYSADSIRSIFNHCAITGLQSDRIPEIKQSKGYYAVQGHSRSTDVSTNQKTVCDFLLVINSN